MQCPTLLAMGGTLPGFLGKAVPTGALYDHHDHATKGLSSVNTNRQRRERAMQALEKEIKARDRAEKTRPLGIAAAALVVILLSVGGIYYATQRTSDDADTQAAATSTEAEAAAEYEPLPHERTKALGETVTCTYNKEGEASKPVDLPNGKDVSARGTVTVTLKTNKGDIPMELDRAVSPCTVNAVAHLAKAGFYNDTVCHRMVTEGLHILQCGDPSGKGSGGPGFQFDNEFPTTEGMDENKPLQYQRGTIAMANAGVNTNGSQFFLNFGDSPLPPLYTYFGQITEAGLKTLDSIAAVGATAEKPNEEIRIESAAVQA